MRPGTSARRSATSHPAYRAGIARRRQVGEQIRRVRLHLSLSQQDVCGRSGIDVATYSRIEQGHASPLLDTLIRIADAMSVELEETTRR
ncbi:helix-turn-helix domain-containing protein [Streptomyces plicatus]|uniref:Helix-turn-helix domain-containing protein n=1 Tax=Streptomyces plicatus TaxID=1922 RepID=A0ABW1XX81_STRPL|nr:helix-turn-helix transcriptional regulator [Streptomyces plicatus]